MPFIDQWKDGIHDLHLPIKLIFAAGRSFKDLNQERYGILSKYGRQVILSHFTKKKVLSFIRDLTKDVLRFEDSALELLTGFILNGSRQIWNH